MPKLIQDLYYSNFKIRISLQLFVIIFVFFITTIADAQSYKKSDLFSKVETAYSQGKLKTCEIHLKNALKKYPQDPYIHIRMAQYYIQIGQAELADIEIEKASISGADEQQLIIPRVKSHLIQGKFNQIIKFKPSLISLPTSKIASYRAIQGQAYLNLGQLNKAKSLFARALRLSPEPFDVQVATARLYSLNQETAKARKIILSLYKQFPHEMDVLLLIGNLYREENQHQQAHEIFIQASRIQPGNISGWIGLVTSLVAQGDFKQADDKVQKLLKINPNLELGNFLQALIAYKLGNEAKARHAINILLRLNPKHKGALWISGALDYNKQRYNDAELKLEEYLAYDSQHFQASKMLAAIYIRKQWFQEAIMLLAPFKNTEDGILYSILGDAYKGIGNTQKSHKYYAMAEKLTPNPLLKSKLLMSKLKLGENISQFVNDENHDNYKGVGYPNIVDLLNKKQTDKAITTISAYLLKNPKEHTLYYLLAQAYIQKKQFQLALENYNKAISLYSTYTQARIALAKLHIHNNKIELARKEYNKILSYKANHEETLLNLAKLEQLEKNYPEMLRWLNTAKQFNINSIPPRLLLNQYYIATKQILKAKEITDELINIKADNIAFLKLHAENLFASKDVALSILVYKKILKLKPDSAEANYWLASAEYIWKDYKNAKKHFQKALLLEPHYYLAQVSLIKLLLLENNSQQALEQSKELIKHHSDKSLSHETLGDVYLSLNQVDKAIKAYQQSYQLKKTNPLIVHKIAKVYIRTGRINESSSLLENWLKKHPNDKKTRMILALIYHKSGQLLKAQKHYEVMLKKQPKNINIINNLALIYSQQNNPKSLEFAEVAYSLQPNSPSVLDTLGWLLVNNDELERGLHLLKQANKQAPNNLSISYHYAVALYENGNIVQAKSKLNLIVPMQSHFNERKQASKLLNKLNLIKH